MTANGMIERQNCCESPSQDSTLNPGFVLVQQGLCETLGRISIERKRHTILKLVAFSSESELNLAEAAGGEIKFL